MADDADEIAVVGIGCNFPGGESIISVLFEHVYSYDVQERKENERVDLSLSLQLQINWTRYV